MSVLESFDSGQHLACRIGILGVLKGVLGIDIAVHMVVKGLPSTLSWLSASFAGFAAYMPSELRILMTGSRPRGQHATQ